MGIDADFSIRIAHLGDENDLIRLMRDLIEELGPHDDIATLYLRMDNDVKRALRDPSIRFFVAERNRCVVGLIRADVLTEDPIFRLRDDTRCGYIDQMFVLPQARGLGLGKRLINIAEAWFVSLKIKHVMLHAAPKATQLYARLNYQPNRQMFKTLF